MANGFRYSLRRTPGNSGSRIVDFLTSKEGFCEQYAAAMGWLARAAGLPARVAFGFARGNNKQGNTYLLTNFNLHAWTESANCAPRSSTPRAPATPTGSGARHDHQPCRKRSGSTGRRCKWSHRRTKTILSQ